MIFTLCSLVVILVVYTVYLTRILKKGLSITDKRLWIGGAEGEVSVVERVSENIPPGKLCALEVTGENVKDQWGGVIKEDIEVPCGKCSDYTYTTGNNECTPFIQEMDLAKFLADETVIGSCKLDPNVLKPQECPFKNPPQM
jgi:hypothetical protein